MGDAGLALGLVGGTHPVPDHVGDDGGAVIRDHHHFHAVGELEIGDGDVECLAGRGHCEQQDETGDETGKALDHGVPESPEIESMPQWGGECTGPPGRSNEFAVRQSTSNCRFKPMAIEM